MSLAIVHTRANQGVDAPLVIVEVHLSNGLPALSMVGLPETAVRESRERVRSAILNAGLDFPARRITINLAPAGIPKSGGRYDLAIAVGILAASQQIAAKALDGLEILGELALTGEIRPVTGVLPAAVAAREAQRRLMLPATNAGEAELVRGVEFVPVADLGAACTFFGTASAEVQRGVGAVVTDDEQPDLAGPPRIEHIRGQLQAKRAVLIAAAGGHNLLLTGSPGTGKTMLANALCGLLPPLPDHQALEVAAVRSVAGEAVDSSSWGRPPFRAPHHGISGVALTGGGRQLNPGEVTLAHGGVLFLDELPEFKRYVLESLREPLEAGQISIARADYHVTLPARFQLVAAMNPCPCGYFGDTRTPCRCTPDRIARYLEKLSGPLLDRIDLHVSVPRVDYQELVGGHPLVGGRKVVGGEQLVVGEKCDDNGKVEQGYAGPDGARSPESFRQPSDREIRDDGDVLQGIFQTSAQMAAQVASCRARQLQRQACLNSHLGPAQLAEFASLDAEGHQLLQRLSERLGLSARACHRAIRVARSIADLEGADQIRRAHIAEAASYRAAFNRPVTEEV